MQSALWKLRDRIDGLPAAPTFPRGRGVMHALLAAEREKVVNKNRVTELMKQIGRVAGDRNAATHTMWATHYPSYRVTPNPWVPRHGALIDDYETQVVLSRTSSGLARLSRRRAFMRWRDRQ